MPPPLLPDTGFYAAPLIRLYRIFVLVKRLKYEQSLKQPVNYQLATNVFANSKSLLVAEILDALRITRDEDRAYFIGDAEPTQN